MVTTESIRWPSWLIAHGQDIWQWDSRCPRHCKARTEIAQTIFDQAPKTYLHKIATLANCYQICKSAKIRFQWRPSVVQDKFFASEVWTSVSQILSLRQHTRIPSVSKPLHCQRAALVGSANVNPRRKNCPQSSLCSRHAADNAPCQTACAWATRCRRISSPTARCHGCERACWIVNKALFLLRSPQASHQEASRSAIPPSVLAAVTQRHPLETRAASAEAAPLGGQTRRRVSLAAFRRTTRRARPWEEEPSVLVRLRAGIAPPLLPLLSLVHLVRCGALLPKQHAVVALFAVVGLPWRDRHPWRRPPKEKWPHLVGTAFELLLLLRTVIEMMWESVDTILPHARDPLDEQAPSASRVPSQVGSSWADTKSVETLNGTSDPSPAPRAKCYNRLASKASALNLAPHQRRRTLRKPESEPFHSKKRSTRVPQQPWTIKQPSWLKNPIIQAKRRAPQDQKILEVEKWVHARTALHEHDAVYTGKHRCYKG